MSGLGMSRLATARQGAPWFVVAGLVRSGEVVGVRFGVDGQAGQVRQGLLWDACPGEVGSGWAVPAWQGS